MYFVTQTLIFLKIKLIDTIDWIFTWSQALLGFDRM